MKSRNYWLDYLRAFACVLVTLGHLLMSFQDLEMLPHSGIVNDFIRLIYCFHVYIFFFCSGYLFQCNKSNSLSSKKVMVYRIEKCINFLILYVLFSGITYLLKFIFNSSVNNQVSTSFWKTLLSHPINQMWYLYAIATIFLFAHHIRSSKAAYLILGIATVLKGIDIMSLPWIKDVLPLNYLCQNLIWFVIGQWFSYKQIKLNLKTSLPSTVLFTVLFILRTKLDLASPLLDNTLTLLGIVSSVGIIYVLTKKKTEITGVWKYLSKYMLQIYLLHTMFAASIRTVLFKVGVSQLLPHLIVGTIFSFVAPIVCAIIAEKTHILNIIFFPIKTVKELRMQKTKSDDN